MTAQFTTLIKVAYVNAPKTAKGPGSIKTVDGTYYKCWKTSKHGGAVLSDFSVGREYEVEYSTEEYNGKEQRTVTKIVSGGGNGANGERSTASIGIAASATPADRSARIERQHSQEMALRFAAGSDRAGDLAYIGELTDHFQSDLDNAPERPAHEQAKEIFNGQVAVTEDEVNRELAEVQGW